MVYVLQSIEDLACCEGARVLHGLGCSPQHPPVAVCGMYLAYNADMPYIIHVNYHQELVRPYRAALQVAAPGWPVNPGEPAEYVV
jgi:hypothetical protein